MVRCHAGPTRGGARSAILRAPAAVPAHCVLEGKRQAEQLNSNDLVTLDELAPALRAT